MADKTIIIDGKTMAHGQGVKESIEGSSADAIVCFDETITDGSPGISYKLEIDRILYESRSYYEKMRDKLKKMITKPSDITTREVIRYKKQQPFVIVKNYSGCVLDAKTYEMKPEEMSAQNLSFKCADMEEYTEDYIE